MNNKLIGAIATAVAIAFATAPISAFAHKATKVACNVKGKVEHVSAHKCKKLGGTVEEEKKAEDHKG